jgi:hypothetical protein
MQTIPIQAIPAQTLQVVLGGQNCQISLRQKSQGVFVDISVEDVDVVVSVIARDAVPLMCREYVGFVGNILFIDTQGSDDPSYEGMGSRFTLNYLTAAENALI